MADSSQDQRRESPGQHQHQHQGQHQHQQPHIHRPIPRRAFSPQIPHDNADADSPTHAFSQQPQPQPHSPTASSLQSSRSSDFLAQLNARLLRTYNANANAEHDAPESPVDAGGARITATKSFLNMNSSTLFGIYDDVSATTTHGVASVADTPWGTGAETPGHTAMGWSGTGTVYDAGGADAAGLSMKPSARRGSVVKGKGSGSERRGSSQSRRARSRSRSARAAVRAAKLAALFTFGVLYGTIVSHLHDTRHLAAVHVKGVDRESWFYMTTWGFAGVALGSLLPYVDLVWGGRRASTLSSRSGVQVQVHVDEDEGEDKDAESPLSEQINDVVRSVAAFLGVAFAIVSPPPHIVITTDDWDRSAASPGSPPCS
ncbi:hypothetical protein B5807_01368 [Epicoccum nigrum]|uniref:Uncharacterized protein n=1 Tax=Epicoccum nigrum TaxID=105696 RepID=A0A1Y2MFA4_EPING|nr:hypothetical protein B5807_01368 [Epicoccum nigrum]